MSLASVGRTGTAARGCSDSAAKRGKPDRTDKDPPCDSTKTRRKPLMHRRRSRKPFVAISRFARKPSVEFDQIEARCLLSILAGPIQNPANNHDYYLLDQSNWTDAEAEAITLGGHLATINDAAENAFVVASFSEFQNVHRSLWIGLTDQ